MTSLSILFLLASGEEGGDGTVWDLFVSFFYYCDQMYRKTFASVCRVRGGGKISFSHSFKEGFSP